MKMHILTTIKLNHPFNSEIWNQYMINAYYKYCLEKFVLPKISRPDKETIQTRCLDLIGPISAVNEAKQKYELMSEIEKQRISVHTQIFESDVQTSTSSTQISNNAPDSYNIILSCCSDDKILSRHLAHRLIDEGYLVSIDYSDKSSSNIITKIHKTDVIITCFSFNYSENYDCMTTMVSINRSGKKIVPIIFTETLLNQQDTWLQRIAIEELFYESFQQEIKFKLKEDLDLDYDKLIVELLQYTKPGAVGRTYPISETILDKEEQREENVEEQNILSRFTPEQIQEKEQIYQQHIEQILEKNKIPEDELTDLIEYLTVVLEDCAIEEQEPDESIQHSNQDDDESRQNEEQQTPRSETEEEEAVVVSEHLSDFLSSIRRWLEKATNSPVIKGSLPPFTLTGDYNDAIFPTSLTNKAPWWVATAKLDDFDHSTPKPYFTNPQPTIGSWCNYDEAHHYYQQLIDKDILFREFKQKQRPEIIDQKQTNTDTTANNIPHHPHFKTNIKKGTTAWDITQNTEVLEEYQRRQNGEKSKKLKFFSDGWNRLMDQSVKLISDINEGKIDIKSDEVQGRIGKELKTKEEIRKRNKLDDPNNHRWRSKKFSRQQEFIEMKIRNTIEWQQFCATQANQ